MIQNKIHCNQVTELPLNRKLFFLDPKRLDQQYKEGIFDKKKKARLIQNQVAPFIKAVTRISDTRCKFFFSFFCMLSLNGAILSMNVLWNSTAAYKINTVNKYLTNCPRFWSVYSIITWLHGLNALLKPSLLVFSAIECLVMLEVFSYLKCVFSSVVPLVGSCRISLHDQIGSWAYPLLLGNILTWYCKNNTTLI